MRLVHIHLAPRQNQMSNLNQIKLRYADLQDFLQIITDEITAFNALTKEVPDSQFIRRLRVRTVFGCIEAQIAHLKASALLLSDDPERMFTPADRLALEDLEERNASAEGTLIRPARIPMKENIKVAFRAFALAANTTDCLDFGNEDGRNFLLAVKIRDRVIHPKSSDHWSVSDDDLAVIDRAWHWFGGNLVNVSRFRE